MQQLNAQMHFEYEMTNHTDDGRYWSFRDSNNRQAIHSNERTFMDTQLNQSTLSEFQIQWNIRLYFHLVQLEFGFENQRKTSTRERERGTTHRYRFDSSFVNRIEFLFCSFIAFNVYTFCYYILLYAFVCMHACMHFTCMLFHYII